MNLVFLKDQDLIDNNKYEKANIKKMWSPKDLGLDGWYGGNIQYVLELNDSPLILIIDKYLHTMDVAIERDKLNELTNNTLKTFLAVRGIKYKINDNKEELLRLVQEVL